MKHLQIPPHRLQCAARALALAAAALLAACGGGGGEPQPPSATFIGVGTLPGYLQSEAYALSADGTVVAGTAQDAGGQQQGFRWTAGEGVTALGRLTGGRRSEVSGMSADGAVIVGSGDVLGQSSQEPSTSSTAFRWTAEGGIQRIPPVAGSTLCSASAVSGDGQSVAGTCLATNNVAFRWTPGSDPVRLGQFGGGLGAASTAAAISRDGRVIAGAGNPFIAGAMLWPATGSPVFIGKLQPSDRFASATALSRDGSVAAGMSVDELGVSWMFRWTEAGGMQRLPAAAGASGGSVPVAISGDGAVIVGWSITSGSESAVIWDAVRGQRALAGALSEEYGLALSGWTLLRANAISDDGRTIAGTGIDPQGATQAWVVHLN